MATLWMKAPDDVLLFLSFTGEEQKRLETIFSADDKKSPWRSAVKALGLKTPPLQKLIYWHHDAPYFNATAMTGVTSNGGVQVVPRPDGKYAFQLKPLRLFALLVSQWKVARFLQRHLGREYPLPPSPDERLVEGLALGIALQSVLMRLDKNATAHMAEWLASPEKIPRLYRKTFAQIQAIQLRRTSLSPVWRELFPARPENEESRQPLPDYFWDAPENTVERAAIPKKEAGWKGMGIYGGEVSGRVVVVTSMSIAREVLAQERGAVILVFRRARPETTELFSFAKGVLFAEGGALSHACTVAREQNMPCITGLGADFFEQIAQSGDVWIFMDGATGVVEIKSAISAQTLR